MISHLLIKALILPALITSAVLSASAPADAAILPSEQSSSPSPNDVIYHTEWHVKSHGAAYTTYSSWHACADATKQSKSYTLSCSVSTTVNNTLTGSIGASVSAINASVGFSTSKTNSVTGGASYTIAANTTGTAYWRSVFTSYKVLQEEYSCTASEACTDDGASETAVASKYKDVGFEYVQK